MTKREEIEKKIRDILDKWTNYEVSLAVRYFIDDRIRLEGGEHKRVNGHDQVVKEFSKLLTKSNEEAVEKYKLEQKMGTYGLGKPVDCSEGYYDYTAHTNPTKFR